MGRTPYPAPLYLGSNVLNFNRLPKKGEPPLRISHEHRCDEFQRFRLTPGRVRRLLGLAVLASASVGALFWVVL